MVALKRYNNKPFNKRVDDDDDDEMENVTESESEPEPELESSDDEEEEEGGDVKLAVPSKTAIYNREGLLDQLRDLSWPENVEWIHKLTIDVDQEQEVDVNDDLARELAFYNQALEGTRMAFDKLQSMKISFLRPADYYAEMVKTDAHMVRVKGRLLEEKKKMEESEERRKARESKKIAKEVQAQKMKEKTKAKKDDFESVKKWRKQRQQSGFAGGDKEEEMMKLSFEDGKGFERSTKRRPGVSPGDRSGGKARQYAPKGKKGNDKKSKSRDHRDSKFGFGGKKGMRKQNTADTTDDIKGFNKGDFSGNKKRKRF